MGHEMKPDPLELMRALGTWVTTQSHPFEKIFGFVGRGVVYRNKIYVNETNTSGHTTNEYLQHEGKVFRLRLKGSVDKLLEIPQQMPFQNTPRTICNLAAFYYANPKLTKIDLLRFIDKNAQKRFLEEYFAKPFFIDGMLVYEQTSLAQSPIAIFKKNDIVVGFGEQKADGKSSNITLKDVMLRDPLDRITNALKTEESKWIYPDVLVKYDAQKDKIRVTFETLLFRHQIKAAGKIYKFDNTYLQTTCFFGKNEMLLHDYPRVITKNYKHFFVHSDGEICYDGDQRFKDIGLQRQKWYSLDDNLLGYKLGQVLFQGRYNLTKGYSEKCVPINRPEQLQELVVG